MSSHPPPGRPPPGDPGSAGLQAGTPGPGGAGSGDPPGFELPLRLFLGFRMLIDDLHAELARQGHAELRPMHGFVFQAIGPDGVTAAELAPAPGRV